jgi:hypothetical protein
MTYGKLLALSALAAALVVIGCASVQSQWKTAVGTNTLDGYQTFANKHAKSTYADSAQMAIERLKFEAADKKQTIAAYQEFIKDNPKSTYVAKANDRIDELQLKAANTIAGYKDFIANHPGSPRIAAAQQSMDKLKADMIAKEPAEAQEVLARYPASAKKGEIPARYVGSWVNPDMWDGVAHDYLLITSSYIIWKALSGPDQGEHVFKPGSYTLSAKGLKLTVKMVCATTGAGDTFKMPMPLTLTAQPGGLEGKLAQSQITVKGKLTDMHLNGVQGVQLKDKVKLTAQPDTFLLVKAGTRP